MKKLLTILAALVAVMGYSVSALAATDALGVPAAGGELSFVGVIVVGLAAVSSILNRGDKK